VEYPEPIALTDAEFDAAVSDGRLLEHHRELFVHSLDTHRIGVTKEAIKEVGAGSVIVCKEITGSNYE
jgi:hypothetical protein